MHVLDFSKYLLPLSKTVVIGFLLGGCAAQQVTDTVDYLVGQTYEDAAACLGIAKTDKLDHSMIAQWDYNEPTNNTSLPIADLMLLPLALPVGLASSGAFSFSSSKSCHLVAQVKNGIVSSVSLSGNNSGISGFGAACQPIISGCLHKMKATP